MDSSSDGGTLHRPVLLEQVLEGLEIKAGGTYIDGTFGRGGHSRAILGRLGADGRLLAIDRDPEAIAEADPSLVGDARFELIRHEFAEIESIAVARGFSAGIDGIVFDLGVSSPQLDRAARGFSFRADGPLDMRMDPGKGESAAEWLSRVEERSLMSVLRTYGEEPQARRIARAIVKFRERESLTSTAQLASVVESVVPRRGSRKHPATRTFQAVRIFLNDELGQIERALSGSVNALRAGGRLCVISFHSLEDRLVKRFMRNASREPEAFRGMPEIPAEHQPRLRTVGRLIRASESEQASNPRSRSARLRIAERR